MTTILNKYEVSKSTNEKGVVVWHLKGQRGAYYTSLRNIKNPQYLFFVGRGEFGGNIKFGKQLWFTDKTGELEIA